MKEMLIRKAEPHEFGAIAQMNISAYREYAERVTEDAWLAMRAKLTSVKHLARDAVFLVACVSGELAGSVAYCAPGKSDPEIFSPDWASVLLLAVSPQYRGSGIGRALVEACIHLAKEDEAQVIGLYTSELMTAAQRLYESMSFQKDGQLPRRHGLRYWRYKLLI